MILEPGTFKVSDHRKAIPASVKIDVLLRAVREHFDDTGTLPDVAHAPAADIRFDHRPPLETRQFDTDAGDFIPPQNDPQHIEAITNEAHDFRTFGRRPGAEKTVTTRGSDAGEAARIRNIQESEGRHQAIMAAKTALAGNDTGAVLDALASIAKSPQRPKQKIPSRPFNSKGKRRFG